MSTVDVYRRKIECPFPWVVKYFNPTTKTFEVECFESQKEAFDRSREILRNAKKGIKK